MKRNRLSRDIANIRSMIRKRMVWIARSHSKGSCPVARGCGCGIDKVLDELDGTERELFLIELESYAKGENVPGPEDKTYTGGKGVISGAPCKDS